MSDQVAALARMSLVSRTIRTDSYSCHPVTELDVARHLWAEIGDAAELDAETAFNWSLTNDSCGVLDLQSGSLPQRITYRITNGSRSILLEPLVLNNAFNLQFQSLKVNLPDKIISNCFVINSFADDENVHYLIINAISESGALFTISFAVSQFIDGSLSINSEEYEEWCHITNAYGFDIRKPHLLYSYSHDYTVVLLKDGGLIGLQQNFKDFLFEPILFNDNSYFESFGNFLKPWSNKPQYLVPNGLSEKTVIDCIHYADLLITITINKKLRVWSKSTQNLLLEQSLDELATNYTSNKNLLDSQPNKLLNILETEQNGTFLTIFLPFGNGIFRIFKLQSSPLDIISLGSDFEFKSNLPESTSVWIVGDFKLIKTGKDLQLWVLWKSGLSSVIQSLSIQEDGSSEWNITTQGTDNRILSTKLANEDWSQYYSRKIFQTYSNKILLTSLSIFQAHFLPKDELRVSEDLTLLDKINKLIGLNITFDKNYDHTIERQWYRFDSLCQEFQKQVEESLKLHIEDNLIILINREGFSTVRHLSNLETISVNKHFNKIDEIDDLKAISQKAKFLSVVSNFKKSLGKEIQDDLLNAITLNLNNSRNPIKEISNQIYEASLNQKINSINLNNFVQQLASFDDFLQIIEDILEDLQSGSEDELTSSTTINSKLTQSGSSLIASSVKQIFDNNFETAFDIFILLLVLEFENKELINSYLKKILKLFKSHYVLNVSFEVTLNDDLNVEVDKSSKFNLFHHLINSEVSGGIQYNDVSLISILENKLINFINSEEFLYKVIIFLVSKGYSELAYYKLLPILDDSLAIANVLKSVIYFKSQSPEKSLKYFILNESRISNYKLSIAEKEFLKPINDFTVFFNTKLSQYYLNLAILFLNNFYFKEAFRFINLSISKKNFTNDNFDDEYREQKFHALFIISLELQDFNNVKYAINNIFDPDLKKESLKRLISTLFKTKSIQKLLDFEFLKDEKLIDQLLYERAQNPSHNFNKALFYYKVLYSFRFKNKNSRGSIESLYEFIYRFKRDSTPDQLSLISDLYLLILNLLRNFKPDDQWIIFHLNEDEDDVLSYEELKQEHLTLLKAIKKLQN